jgi:hypothetical protein
LPQHASIESIRCAMDASSPGERRWLPGGNYSASPGTASAPPGGSMAFLSHHRALSSQLARGGRKVMMETRAGSSAVEPAQQIATRSPSPCCRVSAAKGRARWGRTTNAGVYGWGRHREFAPQQNAAFMFHHQNVLVALLGHGRCIGADGGPTEGP